MVSEVSGAWQRCASAAASSQFGMGERLWSRSITRPRRELGEASVAGIGAAWRRGIAGLLVVGDGIVMMEVVVSKDGCCDGCGCDGCGCDGCAAMRDFFWMTTHA